MGDIGCPKLAALTHDCQNRTPASRSADEFPKAFASCSVVSSSESCGIFSADDPRSRWLLGGAGRGFAFPRCNQRSAVPAPRETGVRGATVQVRGGDPLPVSRVHSILASEQRHDARPQRPVILSAAGLDVICATSIPSDLIPPWHADDVQVQRRQEQLPPMMGTRRKFGRSVQKFRILLTLIAILGSQQWRLPPHCGCMWGLPWGITEPILDMEEVKKQTFCNLSQFVCFCAPLRRWSGHLLVSLTQFWHNSRISTHQPGTPLLLKMRRTNCGKKKESRPPTGNGRFLLSDQGSGPGDRTRTSYSWTFSSTPAKKKPWNFGSGSGVPVNGLYCLDDRCLEPGS